MSDDPRLNQWHLLWRECNDDYIALRMVFVRYLSIVARAEGTDFLDEHEWTPEQWAILTELQRDAAAKRD